MLKLALAFLVAATVYGFGGISESALPILQILFWVFVVFAVLALMIGWTYRKPPSL